MKFLNRKKFKNAAIKLSDANFHIPKFLNYSDIHSILLLFEADDAEKNLQVKKIVQMLKADGKKVTAIGCPRNKKLKTDFPIFEI
jgi:polyphosphate kinase 2 (PPK2 family)